MILKSNLPNCNKMVQVNHIPGHISEYFNRILLWFGVLGLANTQNWRFNPYNTVRISFKLSKLLD